MSDIKGSKDLTQLEKDLRRFIIPVLRRASLRWTPRNEALKLARIERGLYKCASCGETFKPKEIVVDHIDPVVPIEGDDYDWHTFITRLFVSADKLQVLCTTCHDVKSMMEDNLRNQRRETVRQLEKEQKLKEKEEKRLAKKNKV